REKQRQRNHGQGNAGQHPERKFLHALIMTKCDVAQRQAVKNRCRTADFPPPRLFAVPADLHGGKQESDTNYSPPGFAEREYTRRTMTSIPASPAAPRRENLALLYQGLLTGIVRIHSGRQPLVNADMFRRRTKEALAEV